MRTIRRSCSIVPRNLLVASTEARGSALVDKDGRVVGGVFATRDISMRMEALEKLQKRILEAEAAKTKAQMFLDFMSHDISNIITPMLTYANLIGESEVVPAEVKKYSSRIEAQVRKVGRFTANVRRLSSAEMEAYSGFQPVELRSVFQEAEQSVGARHPKKMMVTDISLPDEAVNVPGKGHIEDVIEHVLENAVKHSRGDLVEVEVVVKRDGGVWRVDVTDNGPGITDDQKKLLLADALDTQTSFQRGMASGLSFSGLVLRQLGGELLIEDRVSGDHSKGARIVLKLPVVEVKGPQA